MKRIFNKLYDNIPAILKNRYGVILLFFLFWMMFLDKNDFISQIKLKMELKDLKENRVEIFRVTSGKRKTTNATKLLVDGCKTIKAKNHIKNRNSCDKCEFRHTEYCP